MEYAQYYRPAQGGEVLDVVGLSEPRMGLLWHPTLEECVSKSDVGDDECFVIQLAWVQRTFGQSLPDEFLGRMAQVLGSPSPDAPWTFITEERVAIRSCLLVATRNPKQVFETMLHGLRNEVMDPLFEAKLTRSRQVISDTAESLGRVLGELAETKIGPQEERGLRVLRDMIDSRLQGQSDRDWGAAHSEHIADREYLDLERRVFAIFDRPYDGSGSVVVLCRALKRLFGGLMAEPLDAINAAFAVLQRASIDWTGLRDLVPDEEVYRARGAVARLLSESAKASGCYLLPGSEVPGAAHPRLAGYLNVEASRPKARSAAGRFRISRKIEGKVRHLMLPDELPALVLERRREVPKAPG